MWDGDQDQVVEGCRSQGEGSLGCPALLSLWANTSLCAVVFVALPPQPPTALLSAPWAHPDRFWSKTGFMKLPLCCVGSREE